MAQRSSRKKRKARQRSRAAGAVAGGDKPARGYSAAREKDERARASLEPLEKGERPRAVTVGAVVAFLLAAVNLGFGLAGTDVPGRDPSLAGVAVFSGLMLLVAVGMWKAKYWAVLGMHAILALIVIGSALSAMFASSLGALALALGIVAAAGTLFWFLVKAMARIQMPERPSTERSGR